MIHLSFTRPSSPHGRRRLVGVAMTLALAISPAANPASALQPTDDTQSSASSRQQTSLAEAASAPHAMPHDHAHPASGVSGTQRRIDPSGVLAHDEHFSLGGCAMGYGIPGEQCITAHNKTTICLAAKQQGTKIITPPDDWLHFYLGNSSQCANN